MELLLQLIDYLFVIFCCLIVYVAFVVGRVASSERGHTERSMGACENTVGSC